MQKTNYNSYNIERSDSSNLRSLCIEAGFNETNLVPSNTVSDSVIQLTDKNLTLADKVAHLEGEISHLKEENIFLLNQLKKQKLNHETIEGRVKDLERSLCDSKTNDTQMEKSFEEANKTTDQTTSDRVKKQADIEAQLNTCVTDISGINKKMDVYGLHLTDISKVVYKLESEVQKFVRRHCLVIENFCPKEDSSAMEMLLIFATSVLNVKLEEYDIESLQVIEKVSVESLPGTPEKRTLPRPVLVTFTCYKTQDQIYKSWLSFRYKSNPGTLSKGRGQGITIKEYLTENQEKIYCEALKLKEKHFVTDCWTYKGKTYIKKTDGMICEFSNSNEIVPKSESSSCNVMWKFNIILLNCIDHIK